MLSILAWSYISSWKKKKFRYCLQAFRTVEKLKCDIKGCFKLMVNELFRCLKINILISKILEEK